MSRQLTKGGDFNATGAKVSLTAPASTSTPSRTVLVSRTIPSGAMAILKTWSAKVVDIGNADQVYFAILKNGSPIQSGMERIPGVQFDYQPQLQLDILLTPGLIEIVGYNITGMLTTIEADAVAAPIAVAAQAWWTGELLSERGGM